jgi:hypothetical protein
VGSRGERSLSFRERRCRRGPEGSIDAVTRRWWVGDVSGFAVASQLVDESVPEKIVVESAGM